MTATVELHHLIEGPEDASGLVMSNSLGTTLRMWDDQAPALRSRFRLLRYDHRGHGGSPVPPGPYRIEELGQDLLALLDRLEVEFASFCGLSIGGSGQHVAGERGPGARRAPGTMLHLGQIRAVRGLELPRRNRSGGRR